MLEGDYIEDVEHHEWKKVVLTGSEDNWQWNSNNFAFISVSDIANKPTTEVLVKSNYFLGIEVGSNGTNYVDKDDVVFSWFSGTLICIKSTQNFTNVEETKAFLQEKYNSGNPVIVYYKLATPIDLELTEEQEEAREGLNTYKGVTNISVDNELATLDVEYTAETTEKITNEGNIYSEPIIRLEKTQTEAVELTINDIRFKYNFNNDECVEINCEEKTVEYEGLNRNRQIEIGYDFPKLKVGENEIIMHSGDCVIKVLRKDRWL